MTVQRYGGFAAALMTATCLSDAAIAQQTAQSPMLEEIVVSARKRDESLMQIPVAITAVTSADLDTKGIKSIEEMSRYTPGFFSIFMNAGGGARNDRSARQVTFRGFSIAPGIVFIDGAPVTGVNTGGVTPDFADIERVEVLKGPQNAYFGRSTFSGAVNYVTKTPGNEYKGVVTAEYSSYDSNDLLLSVEGPIVEDKLAVRVTGHHFFKGGHYVNAQDTSKRLGDRTTNSVSASIYVTPTDDLMIKAWGSFANDDDGPPAQTGIKRPQMNCNLGGTGGAYFCGKLPDADELPAANIGGQYTMDRFTQSVLNGNIGGFFTPFDLNFNRKFGLKRHAFQGNVRLEYDYDGYTFAAVTSYNRNKQHNLIDLTYGGTNTNPLFNTAPGAVNAPGIFPTIRWAHGLGNRDWVFNQELRVTSPADQALRWLAGANYLKTHTIGTPVYGYSNAGIAGLGSASENGPKTKSLFAGLYYDVQDDLTVSGELRYQWDYPFQQVLTNGSGTVVLANPLPLRAKFTSFAPRVSVDWKYEEGSLAYALWSRGFRPGGFNAGLFNQPQAIIDRLRSLGGEQTFDEDRIDNFELGLKSAWLDSSLQTRVAVYYNQWRKGQVGNSIQFSTTNPNGSVTVSSFTVTQNVGSINLKGIELEADYAVNENLLLNATLNISDNSIEQNFICGDCVLILGSPQIRPGTKIQFAPRKTWSFSGEYSDRAFADYEWFARMDYSYRGPFFGDFANVAIVPGSNNVNAKIGLRNETYQLEVFVKNLTDDATLLQGTRGPDTVFSFAAFNEVRVGLPDKRTFGIKGTARF